MHVEDKKLSIGDGEPVDAKKKNSLNLTSCEVKIQTFDLIYML